MKPGVVLDIAPLGWSWIHKQYARGIHRVAQKSLDGLLACTEFDISFVATSAVYGSRRFLDESWTFPTPAAFHHTERQIHMDRWSHDVCRWIGESLDDRRLHLRGARWAMLNIANAVSQLAAQFSISGISSADIYHSILAPIPARVSKTKLKRFLTIHDLIPLTHPESVNGNGLPLLRRQLSSLTPGSFAFCVSNDVRNDLLNCTSMEPENAFVTPLAASPETFYPVADSLERRAILRKYGIPDEPYFLTLSSFDPRKNFGHLIRCIGLLAESGELGDCSLVLVGSNPQNYKCFNQTIAEFPKLAGRIITPGFIPDEDLAAIYSGATAFAFPSLSEGFGIPILEAMQCGIAVVSSNTTSMPEVVGDAGVLLDPHDEQAWCSALLMILRDNIFRSRLQNKSLERAKLFSWDRFIGETVKGYRVSLER